MSGYILLYQASRISRPLDVAMTMCQCGERFSVSILFFFREPTFLERAPGAPTHRGVPIPRGVHLSKKQNSRILDEHFRSFSILTRKQKHFKFPSFSFQHSILMTTSKFKPPTKFHQISSNSRIKHSEKQFFTYLVNKFTNTEVCCFFPMLQAGNL